MTRTTAYEPFIDWLKCVGMLLIIYGHMVGWGPLADFPPIYSKQFGVAFFLFVTGYSLMRERRDPGQVVFNRLFEVYLFGVGVALFVSAVHAVAAGGVLPSNYLPFFLGANVIFDNFPANPSTWYLGTYVHIVLLWALMVSRWRVSAGLLVVGALIEVVARAGLLLTAGSFIAYMLVPNWATVFLLGCWYGQKLRTPSSMPARPWFTGLSLLLGIGGWWLGTRLLPFQGTFPFMSLPSLGPAGSAVAVSMMVTTLYVGVTVLTFHLVRSVPTSAPVRFVARNTLFIFLAHMPLLYALQPILRGWGTPRLIESAIYVVLSVVGLGLLSEAARSIVRPRQLRDRIATMLWPAGAAGASRPA